MWKELTEWWALSSFDKQVLKIIRRQEETTRVTLYKSLPSSVPGEVIDCAVKHLIKKKYVTQGKRGFNYSLWLLRAAK